MIEIYLILHFPQVTRSQLIAIPILKEVKNQITKIMPIFSCSRILELFKSRRSHYIICYNHKFSSLHHYLESQHDNVKLYYKYAYTVGVLIGY